MTHQVLVAEPSNEVWKSIARSIRRNHPDAAILRVKDGEQASRFLFQRGLFTDEPETPRLIVLSACLPLVPISVMLARVRQHPKTRLIPLVVWYEAGEDGVDTSKDSQCVG